MDFEEEQYLEPENEQYLEQENEQYLELKNEKWNELVDVSNAEYLIVKTNEFLEFSLKQNNNNNNNNKKNIDHKNKYKLKTLMFYKKMYELANYFNIEWHLISDGAYDIATIYADYYTISMNISNKLVLDVLDFTYKNNFSIVSQYYITVLHICLMST
jgi:hypothetical protein